MWLERFEIIVVSLSRDFLPSSWHIFVPTWVDLGLLTGTLGLLRPVVPRVPAARAVHPGRRDEAAARRARAVSEAATAQEGDRDGHAPALMAEFDCGPALLAGSARCAPRGCRGSTRSRRTRSTGFQELLGVRRSRLTWIALAAGLAGGGGAYLLQWWINVVDYPLEHRLADRTTRRRRSSRSRSRWRCCSHRRRR